MNYKIIFDLGGYGYKFYPPFSFSIIYIQAVLVLAFFFFNRNLFPKLRKQISIVVWGGAIVMLIIFLFLSIDYLYLRLNYAMGNYKVVEGKITEFNSALQNPKNEEAFTIGHQYRFRYSESDLTPGFNLTKHQGNPLYEGAYVRVTYIDDVIVKLEIK